MSPVVLFRPLGPLELELVRQAGWLRFPPRLPGQPFFYPVLQEAYARAIAQRWNVAESGAGHVVRFGVVPSWLARFPPQPAGGRAHTELWIPAELLEVFNDQLVGPIELIGSWYRQP